MATDTGERFSPHLRGVTVTTLATLLGLVAGVASAVVASGPQDTIGVAFFLGAVGIQFPVYSLVGIDVDGFSKKDYIYVAFMTGVLWFLSWGLLLTTGAF